MTRKFETGEVSEAFDEEAKEGWFTDPYERHEARWFSEGRPTELVRDGAAEAHDAVPEAAPTGPANPIEKVVTEELRDPYANDRGWSLKEQLIDAAEEGADGSGFA